MILVLSCKVLAHRSPFDNLTIIDNLKPLLRPLGNHSDFVWWPLALDIPLWQWLQYICWLTTLMDCGEKVKKKINKSSRYEIFIYLFLIIIYCFLFILSITPYYFNVLLITKSSFSFSHGKSLFFLLYLILFLFLFLFIKATLSSFFFSFTDDLQPSSHTFFY